MKEHRVIQAHLPFYIEWQIKKTLIRGTYVTRRDQVIHAAC
jgi:hypothetical protein